MASLSTFLAFFFFFTTTISSSLAVSPSLLKGKVSCFDCPKYFDYSGIMVTVSCDQTKTHFKVKTDEKGEFLSELPSRITSNCEAKIQGSFKQLYGFKKNMKSKIVKAVNGEFGLVSKLIFLKSCPRNLKSVRSSKTVDFPVPPEWGLAPTSYYLPFFPIIGIP